MKALNILTAILIIVGGLNWGLAVFNFNLVEMLLGSFVWLEKTVYALVGLAALYQLFLLFGQKK